MAKLFFVCCLIIMVGTMGSIYVDETSSNMIYQDMGFWEFCLKYIEIQIRVWLMGW